VNTHFIVNVELRRGLVIYLYLYRESDKLITTSNPIYKVFTTSARIDMAIL